MLMNQPPEAAERELILRQLFLLRQDVEYLKQFATEGSIISNQMDVPMIGQESESSKPSLHINHDSEYFIKNSSIGDMSLED